MIPAILIVFITETGCDPYSAVGIVSLAMFFNGGFSSGQYASFLDMAPNYAGTILGISNTLASITGLITPMVIGYITLDNNTFDAWRLVFGIAAVVYFVGNLFYVVLVKGEVQDWNGGSEEELEEEMQERKSLKGPD